MNSALAAGTPVNISGNAASASSLKDASGTVDVSAAAAPSTQQVLTATGAGAATWQDKFVQDTLPIVKGAVDSTKQVRVSVAGMTTANQAVITVTGTAAAPTWSLPGTTALATVTASGTITPSQTNGIVGTTTNNSANAGSVGELLSATIATGSSVTLTTNTAANVTSVSLTAGDWDVSGVVDYTFAATTAFTSLIQGISTASASVGAQDTFSQLSLATNVPGGTTDSSFVTPVVRISIAGTTTVYLVTKCLFTVASLKAYGTIRARRVR